MSTPFNSHAGALAPVDPAEPYDSLLTEQRREERINAPRLSLFLNRTLDAIGSLDANENLKIHNTMVRNVAYYDGRFDGEVRNGEWHDNETITGEIVAKDNDYKKQIDKLAMEMVRSRISYMVDAVLRHQAAKREAAQFAAWRLQVNQERIETEPFIQAENLSLLKKGTAFRYSFFDKNAYSQEQSIELQAIRAMRQGAEVAVCRTCGMSAPNPAGNEIPATSATADIGPPCPHCGDTKRKPIKTPDSYGIDTQQKKVRAGRVVTVRPDATMVQLDLNARDISGSSFVRWRLVLRRCDWEAMYPDQRIPSSDESVEARHRAEAQNTPSNSGWPTSSENTGGDQFEKIEGELVWLDAKVYQRYRNREAESLGRDKVLTPGTLLTDQFPDGVCVTRIGRKILDLYPSNKNKCWVMCVYGLREHALHGSGTTALLGPQDIINEENSTILASHIYGAIGRELMRSGAVEGGQLPRIDQVAYINAPDEVMNIAQWAAGRIQPNPLSSDVYGYREAMQGSMQDAAGSSSLSNQGASDMKELGTATGVEASRDMAVGRMIPNRKLQAFMGSQWGQQVLELERDNYAPEVFLDMAEKGNEKGEILFTERGVRTFFQSDVCNDYIVKPVEGSWMPVSPAQEQAKASEFGMLSAQMKDAPHAQEVLSLLAPKYGIPYGINEFGAAQYAASLRMEVYTQICADVADPEIPPTPEIVQVVLANCPEWARVDDVMDEHPAFIDYYTDWWLMEGRKASSLLRMVVKAIVGLHKAGLVAQGQEKSEMETAVTAPAMAAAEEAAAVQAEQAAAQAKQQAEAAHAQAEQDMLKQALGQQVLKEQDTEHKAAVELNNKLAIMDRQAEIDRSAAQLQTDENIEEAKAISRFAPKPASN